jgi:hypothetical protein
VKLVDGRTRAKNAGSTNKHASGLRGAGPLSSSLQFLLEGLVRDATKSPWYSHDGIGRYRTRSTSLGSRAMGSRFPPCVAEPGSSCFRCYLAHQLHARVSSVEGASSALQCAAILLMETFMYRISRSPYSTPTSISQRLESRPSSATCWIKSPRTLFRDNGPDIFALRAILTIATSSICYP